MVDDQFGPEWRSYEKYRLFAESIKTDLRYVRRKPAADFLEKVLASSQDRRATVTKGYIYFRARLGCDFEEVSDSKEEDEFQVTHLEDRPYGASAMKPISNWQSEGRANPRGIPYPYLATTAETAMAEVRPWIGATISVAQVQILRDLTLIDCARYHTTDHYIELLGDPTRKEEEGMWTAIDGAFATRVSREDESKEYAPTQVIAELFKSEGFDGIVYKSLLSDDGYNLAIFNLHDAAVVHCELYKADSLRFKFNKTGTAYFKTDDGK